MIKYFLIALVLLTPILALSDARAKKELSFETLYTDVYAWAATEQQFLVITDDSEWASFRSEYEIQAYFEDFNHFFLIAAFQGYKPTGGYGIEITRMVQDENVVTVTVYLKEPKPGEPVTEAFTSPCHIVKVAKSEVTKSGEILFIFLNVRGEELCRIKKVIA